MFKVIQFQYRMSLQKQPATKELPDWVLNDFIVQKSIFKFSLLSAQIPHEFDQFIDTQICQFDFTMAHKFYFYNPSE